MHNAAWDQRAINLANVAKAENAQVNHESIIPRPAPRLYPNTTKKPTMEKIHSK
jgi:hypothetical protein